MKRTSKANKMAQPATATSLSSGWSEANLSDLCSLVSKQCDPKTTDMEVYVGLEHIDPGSFALSRFGHPKEVVSAKNRFQKGDILYGKLRPYLDKAVIADREGICSTDILVFRPTNQVNGRFLLALIHQKAFVEYAVQTTHGVNHPRTSWTALREYRHGAPPLPEQERIAGILSTIQEAIATEADIIRNARDLKKSLLHHLFTHGLHNEPLKETEIGKIPESWNVVPLGDRSNICASAMSYSQLLQYEDNCDGVDVYGVKVSDMNLRGNEQSFESANLTKRIPVGIAEKRTIPAGAVVFPKRGAAIATNKKRLTTTWTVLDPNLMAVVPCRDIVSLFLFNWFQSLDLGSITEPGPTPQINRKNIAPLLFPLPSLSEQTAIATILLSVDAKIANHEAKQCSLQELFITMLHELMMGKMRNNYYLNESQGRV